MKLPTTKGKFYKGLIGTKDEFILLALDDPKPCSLPCHHCTEHAFVKGIVVESKSNLYPIFDISDTWCMLNPDVFKETTMNEEQKGMEYPPPCIGCDRIDADTCMYKGKQDKQWTRIGGCAARTHNKAVKIEENKPVDPLKASKKSMKKR